MKNKQAWRNRLLRITAAGSAWWWQTGLVWAATEKDLAKTGTAGANTPGKLPLRVIRLRAQLRQVVLP